MHDIRLLREAADTLRDAMRRRGEDELAVLVERAVELEQERRTAIQACEERKAARNAASHEVARRKKAGEPADEQLAAARVIGDEIVALEARQAEAQDELDDILAGLPNIPLPDVPAGDETCNQVLRTWGTPRAAGPAPHWEVGARLGLFDLERGAKVAGSGFIVYRGAGARLQRALIALMLDMHTREFGYEEASVPYFVNRDAMVGTGQLPKFEDDMYALRDEPFFAIPTAEVPLTNLFRHEILDGARLPLAMTGHSACFRREAGAAGKDTRGLLRVHQFDKVELVRWCAPEDSPAQHELLTSHAEEVLQRLELPYRVVLLAAGDTGFASAKTYDLEVFAPGVDKWLEVSSCSTFTDFQARRANIRYRPEAGGKPRFVHTLNGSAVALPRVVAAILEHHQQADGSVNIPPALRQYFGSDRIG
ncbi:MAG: serine--tRNA ligase [Gemmatimonadetes bacterium]|nr:serine--tRNA ligase [Gemmatimonadota bacterium]